MIKKIKRLLRYYIENLPVILLVSNWWVVLLGYLNLLKLSDGIFLYLRNGMKFLIVHHLDALVLREIIWSNEYKFAQTKDSMTIVDIGANIGTFSIYCNSISNKNRIIALEPSPATFKQLKKNLCVNDVENVEAHQVAIFSKPGILKLYDNVMSGQRSLFSSKNNRHYTEVTTTTLERIMRKHKIKKIDFLKMDCEGSEYEILSSLKSSTYRKIDSIALEYHELKRGQNKIILVDILEKNGFKVEIKPHTIEKNIGYIWASKRKSRKS